MRHLQLRPNNELTLTNYDGDNLPPYAILSHTWGADDDEVTYEDIVHGSGRKKPGYTKIMFCGQQAEKDDLKHFWVDSCCIKKIERFRALRISQLNVSLVSALKRDSDDELRGCESAFRKSRWFTRGWTLQELLPPKIVEFWSRDRQLPGTCTNALSKIICDVTKIPPEALGGVPMAQFTVNDRQRWAACRDTKREEDKAYCLWGLFDVSMSCIYGEGEERALERLEDEIRKRWALSRAPTGLSDQDEQGREASSAAAFGDTTPE